MLMMLLQILKFLDSSKTEKFKFLESEIVSFLQVTKFIQHKLRTKKRFSSEVNLYNNNNKMLVRPKLGSG